jgi:drug/metabolite transporter (DMT)-like permease
MKFSPRLKAILMALLVTFLWSTSWVLIKTSLTEISPLTFAGLRYFFAFLVLLPLLWQRKKEMRKPGKKDWLWLIVLGLVFYTFTQGGQFVTLKYLEAVTFSLLLNFSTVLVALFSIIGLREKPGALQWTGIGLFLAGALVYFYPVSNLEISSMGLLFAGLTVTANAAASVLGRWINRDFNLPPLLITVVSMGVGAVILLVAGLLLEGWPIISLQVWGVILWLAVVNTALAFTLWNHTLQVLSAVESSIINNTMLAQIAVLAWVFLGERLSLLDITGLLLAMLGALLVQVKNGNSM